VYRERDGRQQGGKQHERRSAGDGGGTVGSHWASRPEKGLPRVKFFAAPQ